MNFFEKQQLARRNTRVMVVLFLLAVAGIVLAVNLVLAITWLSQLPEFVRPRPGQAPLGLAFALASVPSGLYVFATLGTLAVILGVSLREISTLRRGGGAAVAMMMGASPVSPNTTNLMERRLLNVVEEMAIAAGTRVPAVYVMRDEPGINAFAAGYDISSSVIAVTRGTLDKLNRDELQSVIGHELSHVVNGDMALNIRMIGVLSGIIFIGASGGFLVRSVWHGMAGRSRSKAGGAVLLLGVGLYVTGYIGLFFARLIKAAASRQREFLADASSVQFTRNPEGLAGALDQIRANVYGSLINHRHAEDVSHLFFGQGIRVGVQGLFATHPPLEERIRRINPRFPASEYRRRRQSAGASGDAPQGAMGFSGEGPGRGPFRQGGREGDASKPWDRPARKSVELVGSLDAREISVARSMLDGIAETVRERVREPEGAAATVIALVLAHRDEVMQAQVAAARTAGRGRLAEAAAALSAQMRAIGPAYYLLLIDLALPALKRAGEAFKAELLDTLETVIHADRRVSMFEFALSTLMRSQLLQRATTSTKYRSLAELRAEAVFALSLLANAGAVRAAPASGGIDAGFQAGAFAMGLANARPLAREALGLKEAGEVFTRLRDLAPLQKALFIKGMFATVTSDGTIRVVEAATMRMVSAVLDCPLPPLLENLDPATLEA